MLMKKIYLYPKVYPTENPYISNLEKALNSHFIVVNRKNNTKGVLDLFRYFFKADIFYFNWIENIPSRKFGKAQVVIFVVFLFLIKALGKKVIWTLHNKYSHEKADCRWTDFMYSLMFRRSDFILTHSGEGIDFAEKKYPKDAEKVKYYIHPVTRLYPVRTAKDPVYDFLIWGTIWPYKGIVEFLKFLKDAGEKPSICLAGICVNEEMKNTLGPWLSDNIVHIDRFLGFDEIADLANKSRFTLFTYATGSVLSSGSLMDSIAMGSVVIGPDAGAFRDLSSYGFVKTYKRYEDIIEILKTYGQAYSDGNKNIESFWEENNWDKFGNRLTEDIMTSLFK